MSAKLWINHEWLDTLGLEMPQTTEEYAEVLRAFKTEDPSANPAAGRGPTVELRHRRWLVARQSGRVLHGLVHLPPRQQASA